MTGYVPTVGEAKMDVMMGTTEEAIADALFSIFGMSRAE